MNSIDEKLKNIYYQPSSKGGFGGEQRLVRAVKGDVTTKQVKACLRSQDTFTLHRPLRYKFPMLHYNVTNIDDLWEADLIDLGSLKSYNDGVTFILVCIDVLSKYVWVEPLKDKSNEVVKQAFKSIFKKTERRPQTLQTDSGKEFVGKTLQNYLKENKINFRKTRNPDVKAAVVERFNRTLKEKMFRYFTFSNTKRYIDVLQELVKGYNNTTHSSIKMEPAAVSLENAQMALRNIRSKYPATFKAPKYPVGQYVRISRKRGVFEKSYEAGWTEEIFKIKHVLTHRKPVVYEIEDLNGEIIDGFFYEEEINPVNEKSGDTEYIIERIIRSSGRGGNKKFLVKWQGWPDSFNSWIPAKDLKKV